MATSPGVPPTHAPPALKKSVSRCGLVAFDAPVQVTYKYSLAQLSWKVDYAEIRKLKVDKMFVEAGRILSEPLEIGGIQFSLMACRVLAPQRAPSVSGASPEKGAAKGPPLEHVGLLLHVAEDESPLASSTEESIVDKLWERRVSFQAELVAPKRPPESRLPRCRRVADVTLSSGYRTVGFRDFAPAQVCAEYVHRPKPTIHQDPNDAKGNEASVPAGRGTSPSAERPYLLFSFKMCLHHAPDVFIRKFSECASAARDSFHAVGLKNHGTTCFLNALLQVMFHTGYFRREIYHLSSRTTRKSEAAIQLQRVLVAMEGSPVPVATMALIHAMKMSPGEQQDAHEVLLEFFLHRVLKYCAELYAINVEYVTRCEAVDFVSSRRDKLFHLGVCVRGFPRLEDAIAKELAPEPLVDLYDTCHKVYGKQKASRQLRIRSFPPVLFIQVKRFDAQARKVHDAQMFPEDLELKALLEKPRIHNDEQPAGAANSENTQPDDAEEEDVSELYTLHGVVVHHGNGVSSGHYSVFIRQHDTGQYLHFDDEAVTMTSREEVLEQYTGTHWANPGSSAYILVYLLKKQLGEALRVETVPSEVLNLPRLAMDLTVSRGGSTPQAINLEDTKSGIPASASVLSNRALQSNLVSVIVVTLRTVQCAQQLLGTRPDLMGKNDLAYCIQHNFVSQTFVRPAERVRGRSSGWDDPLAYMQITVPRSATVAVLMDAVSALADSRGIIPQSSPFALYQFAERQNGTWRPSLPVYERKDRTTKAYSPLHDSVGNISTQSSAMNRQSEDAKAMSLSPQTDDTVDRLVDDLAHDSEAPLMLFVCEVAQAAEAGPSLEGEAPLPISGAANDGRVERLLSLPKAGSEMLGVAADASAVKNESMDEVEVSSTTEGQVTASLFSTSAGPSPAVRLSPDDDNEALLSKTNRSTITAARGPREGILLFLKFWECTCPPVVDETTVAPPSQVLLVAAGCFPAACSLKQLQSMLLESLALPEEFQRKLEKKEEAWQWLAFEEVRPERIQTIERQDDCIIDCGLENGDVIIFAAVPTTTATLVDEQERSTDNRSASKAGTTPLIGTSSNPITELTASPPWTLNLVNSYLRGVARVAIRCILMHLCGDTEASTNINAGDSVYITVDLRTSTLQDIRSVLAQAISRLSRCEAACLPSQLRLWSAHVKQHRPAAGVGKLSVQYISKAVIHDDDVTTHLKTLFSSLSMTDAQDVAAGVGKLSALTYFFPSEATLACEWSMIKPVSSEVPMNIKAPLLACAPFVLFVEAHLGAAKTRQEDASPSHPEDQASPKPFEFSSDPPTWRALDINWIGTSRFHAVRVLESIRAFPSDAAAGLLVFLAAQLVHVSPQNREAAIQRTANRTLNENVSKVVMSLLPLELRTTTAKTHTRSQHPDAALLSLETLLIAIETNHVIEAVISPWSSEPLSEYLQTTEMKSFQAAKLRLEVRPAREQVYDAAAGDEPPSPTLGATTTNSKSLTLFSAAHVDIDSGDYFLSPFLLPRYPTLAELKTSLTKLFGAGEVDSWRLSIQVGPTRQQQYVEITDEDTYTSVMVRVHEYERLVRAENVSLVGLIDNHVTIAKLLCYHTRRK